MTPFPPWARWIAQNRDGSIYVFNQPPCLSLGYVWTAIYLTNFQCIGKGTPNPHWRNSLDCLGEDDNA